MKAGPAHAGPVSGKDSCLSIQVMNREFPDIEYLEIVSDNFGIEILLMGDGGAEHGIRHVRREVFQRNGAGLLGLSADCIAFEVYHGTIDGTANRNINLV